MSEILKEENRICEEFEVMLAGLTLEEVIGLKLEVAIRQLKGKLYGLKIYAAIGRIAKYSAFMYSLRFLANNKQRAAFLGVDLRDFTEMKRTYGYHDNLSCQTFVEKPQSED